MVVKSQSCRRSFIVVIYRALIFPMSSWLAITNLIFWRQTVCQSIGKKKFDIWLKHVWFVFRTKYVVGENMLSKLWILRPCSLNTFQKQQFQNEIALKKTIKTSQCITSVILPNTLFYSRKLLRGPFKERERRRYMFVFATSF